MVLEGLNAKGGDMTVDGITKLHIVPELMKLGNSLFCTEKGLLIRNTLSKNAAQKYVGEWG